MRSEFIELLNEFRCPEGYKLSGLLGCSYTFDARIGYAFLAAASSYSVDEMFSIDEDKHKREELRNLVINAIDKSLFFVDPHGPIYGLEKIKGAANCFWDQVVKKGKKSSDSFGSIHSKFVLAVYEDETGRAVGRLYVGSKNLVNSNMREVGVVLNLSQAGKGFNFHSDLLGMLKTLRDDEGSDLSDYRAKRMDTILRLMKKYKLAPSHSDLRFCWQSRKSKGVDSPTINAQIESLTKKQKWTRIDVQSPWVREAPISWLQKIAPSAELNIRCLKEQGVNYLQDNRLNYEFDHPNPNREIQEPRWHQKTMLFENERMGLIVFGSANFTTRGFGFGEIRNTESMIFWPSSAQEGQFLRVNNANDSGENLSINPASTSKRQELINLLCSLEISVSYLQGSKKLKYCFDAAWKVPIKLEVTHFLIEPIEEASKNLNEIKVFSGTDLTKTPEISWEKRDIYLISSLVRVKASLDGESVEVDYVIELPELFYESRTDKSKFRSYRLDRRGVFDALLDLMGEPVTQVKPDGTADGAGDGVLVEFSKRICLERLAYRLAFCKSENTLLFKQRMNRLKNLLPDIEALKIDEAHNAFSWGELKSALEGIIHVLEK